MNRIFFTVIGYLSLVTYTFASDDLTSSNFTVDLCSMDPVGCSSNATVGGVGAFTKLLGSVSNVILFAIPIVAAVSFIIAGYFYIFSAGDSEKVNKAKIIIKWNIIAMLVAFLSYGIVKIVASFFNAV